MGIFTIALILAGAFIRMDYHDMMMHNINRITAYKDEFRNVDSKYLAFRAAVVGIAVLYTINIKLWQGFLSLLMMLLMILPYFYFIIWLPHRWNIFNYGKCAVYLCSSGAFLNNLLVTLNGCERPWIYPLLFILGGGTCYARIMIGKMKK